MKYLIKINVFIGPTASTSTSESSGWGIHHLDCLNSILANIPCPTCNARFTQLTSNAEKRQGFANHFLPSCTQCDMVLVKTTPYPMLQHHHLLVVPPSLSMRCWFIF